MVLDERYDFLKDIKLNELKGKEEDFIIFKGIKFNKNERNLLKFIQWKGVKFSNYVKQLIEQDMRNTIEGNENIFNKNSHNKLSDLDEEYLMSLIEKVLESRENKNEVKKEVVAESLKEENKKALGALNKLGICKR
ncbi:hypothetical protein [Clostridium tarantellae]|uniref:Uncharacterized protein n=1 Tax=Clostridium tarantellae TaxID=39493 RepID=A0A6I1MKS5_9CLOT|nr:hypothetical protein [Clostridium tarantellae]MPQ44126.1 hypothetical protein [Clostridium tarantellae]